VFRAGSWDRIQSIFLNLLECEAERMTQLLLTPAQQGPALANSVPDMNIDWMGVAVPGGAPTWCSSFFRHGFLGVPTLRKVPLSG
jgi:RES domain-containing protein